MPWRDWSEHQRSQAVNAASVVFLLVSAATWTQGAPGWAAVFAATALMNVVEGLWRAYRGQPKSGDNGSEPGRRSVSGPVWVSNTYAAFGALAYSLCTPLAVAAGIGLTLAGASWGLPGGVLMCLMLLRLGQPRVREYADATGAKATEWALLTPGYLRFYAAPLGLDWRAVAAVCWLAPAALAGFWVFLRLNAALALSP